LGGEKKKERGERGKRGRETFKKVAGGGVPNLVEEEEETVGEGTALKESFSEWAPG